MPRLFVVILALSSFLLSGWLLACDAPVYRYALERWPAENFPVFVFYNGKLENRHQAWINALRLGNIQLKLVDTTRRLERVEQEVFTTHVQGRPLPYVVAYEAPSEDARRAHVMSPVFWAGAMDGPQGRDLLVSSPTARHAAELLAQGQVGVWVCVQGFGQEADGAFAAALTAAVGNAQREVIAPEIASGRVKRPDGVKPELSVVFLDKHAPSEVHFVKMLSHQRLVASKPTAYLLYGRGRVMSAVDGEGIASGAVKRQSAFLVGPCSCEIKAQNPGQDLLLAADWDAQVAKTIPDKDSEPAPLTGMGSFILPNAPASLGAPNK